MENWKQINGFIGKYEISNLGRVKSLARVTPHGHHKKERILKNTLLNTGYYQVNLYSNKGPVKKALHRLIATAFLPNPDNKPYINHIDGNPRNNSLNNLEWCNASENQIHAMATGLNKRGVDHGKAKLNIDDVVFIRTFRSLYSWVDLSKIFKVDPKTIRDAFYAKSWKHI